MNIDLYCERLTDQFWAEPINAITNIAFVLAGLWGIWRISKSFNVWSLVLSFLSIMVGIGSFLFHTYANKQTHLLDLIPIFILTLVFVFYTFSKVLRFSYIKSFLSLFIFLSVMILIEVFVPKTILNGSLLYFPALMTLVMVSIKIKTQNQELSQYYQQAAMIFLISLTFRTLDNEICEMIAIGTHFMWHLLNGVLLAIMIQITWEVEKALRYTKLS